jgi:two-component system chemotaxis response regulator CheB
MPKMDGITFLRNLMRLRPMPVVMCSSLTQQGADVTLDALSLGAVDYVSKPGIDAVRGLQDAAHEIIEKVKIAARAQVRALDERAVERVRSKSASISAYQTTDSIIAIGASTGGTEAIKDVLQGLPADVPGIVIVQHIPRAFSGRFAKRMDSVCGLNVSEAEDGQVILSGHAYIAPGDQHLLVKRDGARYRCELSDAPRVNRHRPSADVLFHSVAEAVGRNAIAVLLTGMGNDGARGMLAMRNAGARTLVQDEYTSVVWGMPGAAWELGAAETQHALTDIPAHLLHLLTKSGPAPRAMGASS